MIMLSPKYVNLVILFITVFAFQEQVLAVKNTYIVYLGGHSHGPEITSADLHRVTNSHHEFLGSFLESKEDAKEAIIYSYKRHINGFAAILEEEDAAKIAKHPDVVSVFLNQARKLHTTRSWNFMNLEDSNGVVKSGSLWEKANFGQDVIIANIDSGVWPESKSFSDEGYGPIPSRWKGICQNSTIFPCNRKLIGARYFNKAYLAYGEKIDPSLCTPRDHDGHGSHTLSTAAGNFVPGTSFYGLGNGTAKGGAPNARVAAYKVCWGDNCMDADILEAFDVAIDDGVDVLSVSLGGALTDYFSDGIAIGAFHALKKNVMVVVSAGNSGPLPGSVSNVAPWSISVGASTIDRQFLSAGVDLPNGQHFKGMGIYQSLPESKFYPLIDAKQANNANSSADKAELCENGTLDRQKVEGKILVCLRGVYYLNEKDNSAVQAGAVGMILRNQNSTGDVLADYTHSLPAVNIGHKDGLSLLAYMNSTTDPKGYVRQPVTLTPAKPAPVMADFSSRGPNLITPEILKPDITAPGVNILAAYSENFDPDSNEKQPPFNILSGTSMSCPHVAGIVGLLKALHPDWSPAAIKSAIMTTARTRDNTMRPMKDTPFDHGAGHVQPNRAMDPGLVYDLTEKDHLDYLCAIGYDQKLIRLISGGPYECPKNLSLNSFNYPAIIVPNIKASDPVKITRRLKNVGTPGIYTARLRHPSGVCVIVEPAILKFEETGEEKSFTLTVQANDLQLGEKLYGHLIWSDGKNHHVRSPIVVASFVESFKESHPRIAAIQQPYRE